MGTSRVLMHAWVCVSLALAIFGQGCSSSDSDGGGGLTSCDIVQGNLHYCQEASGATGSNSGCPTGTAGFTPGNGCSRSDVAGTCKQGPYTFYLYEGGSASAALLESLCPDAGFVPNGIGGTGSGTSANSHVGGSTATGSAVACQLEAPLVGSCLTVVGTSLYACTEWTIDGAALCAAGHSTTVTSTWTPGVPCPADWTMCCQNADNASQVPVNCIYPANAAGTCSTSDTRCSL